MIPENTSSPASPDAPQGLKPHRMIKLGVDGHWRERYPGQQSWVELADAETE